MRLLEANATLSREISVKGYCLALSAGITLIQYRNMLISRSANPYTRRLVFAFFALSLVKRATLAAELLRKPAQPT